MNITNLIGRLVKAPELRYLNSGTATAQFTLAVDKQLSKDKKQQFEQQGKPTADFIRIVTWGKIAEHCANYLNKGKLVAVTGSINTGKYVDNNGNTRYTFDVVAQNVQFLEFGDKKQQSNDFVEDFGASDVPF